MIRRIIQGLLIFAIGAFLVVILSLAGTFLYVYFNREVIISRVSATVNRSISGELVTGKISIDFIHYFPATAVHISDVSIRDSLFKFHKMEFLRASDVYIKVNFMELFSAQPALENITFKDGSIFIFRDRSGHSNRYLLHTKTSENSTGSKTPVKGVDFENFRFVFNDQIMSRYHNIFFNKLKCEIHDSNGRMALAINSNGKIKMLSFNLSNGAYARDATFNTNVIIYYNKRDTVLEVPEHTFYLNEQLVVAKARFHFGEASFFSADFNAPRILFDNAIKLVTIKTERLLSKYKPERPLRIQVHLEGGLKPGSKPLINAELITSANIINYKGFKFTQARLHAIYTNRADTTQEISIANNEVILKYFSGNWNGIPVSSEVIRFFNFPFPSVEATLRGSFPLRDLNRLPGGGLYNFSQGTGSYKLAIVASSDSNIWKTAINLNVIIKNGELVYEPRGMPFQDVNANIIIRDNDLFIQSASCRSGSSLFSLKGQAPGLFNTDLNDLRQAQLNWEINSSYINLDDFTTFLGRRKKGVDVTPAKSVAEKSDFGKHMDRYLDACRLKMKLNIDALRYDKFAATGLSGLVELTDDKWSLEDIRFNHAGGEVKLSGKLSPQGENMQSVNIQSGMKHVNISEVFTAFGNFSQQTLTAGNINGTLDADVQLGFTINNKASISQSSIIGMVDLSIREGELKGFQPMGKLSRYLFRKRDFTDIKFSELTNSFIARGNEIYFDRMKINTNVMELYIEGSYFLNGKTDMQIQIPLSNLKSRDWSELSENITDRGDKGMNVYIHATTDENGDLKFKYDPLKKIKDKRPRK